VRRAPELESEEEGVETEPENREEQDKRRHDEHGVESIGRLLLVYVARE
jgi:hypothetical protein